MSAAPAAWPTCICCARATAKRDGRGSSLRQRFRCCACRRTFTERTGTPFAGHRWPLEVITTAVPAVRWYVRYRLSAADVRALLSERGIDGSARTVLTWTHTFGSLLAVEARRYARPVGTRWYADETSVRVAGQSRTACARCGDGGPSRSASVWSRGSNSPTPSASGASALTWGAAPIQRAHAHTSAHALPWRPSSGSLDAWFRPPNTSRRTTRR